MNHPEPASPDPSTPPPPRPGPTHSNATPEAPTDAQLRAAAACLAALAYHNPPPRTAGSGPMSGLDTLWHLSAYTKTACVRTGVPFTEEVRLRILRITVGALGAVAAVRPNELACYLEAITPSQQSILFSLVHRRLAGPRPGEYAAPEPVWEGQEEL